MARPGRTIDDLTIWDDAKEMLKKAKAEGIETALSAFALFGVPTWAAVTAGGLERWTPPNGTERVVVFGDNDTSGTGQAAAWVLAKRLIVAGLETEVKIPEVAGTDWNDFHRQQGGGR